MRQIEKRGMASAPPSAALLLYQTAFFDRVLPQITHNFWQVFDQSRCSDVKYVQDRAYSMTDDAEAFEAFYGKMRDFPDSTKYIMKNWVYTMRREANVNARYGNPQSEESDVSCENRRYWTNFWKAMSSKIYTMPHVCADMRLRLVVAQQSILTAVCETALIIDENGNLPIELMPPPEEVSAPHRDYPPSHAPSYPSSSQYAPPSGYPPQGGGSRGSSSYSGGGRARTFVVPSS